MKTIKSLLAVALVAVSASYVSAQDSKAFSGAVVAVSDTSITVKTDSGDKTFAIDSGTKFVDAAGAADIKAGQQVGIRADGGETKALLIRGKWPIQ